MLSKFYKNDSGAVTVDWVVLTAAIVGIAIAVITLISSGVEDASTGINDELIVASNFTFGGDGGNGGSWASGYVPLSSQHGDTWNGTGVDAEGRNWTESTYDSWSTLSDNDLMDMYAVTQAQASSSSDPLFQDYIAVQEQIMTDRGIPIT